MYFIDLSICVRQSFYVPMIGAKEDAATVSLTNVKLGDSDAAIFLFFFGNFVTEQADTGTYGILCS